jgi:hypothetical protein
MLGMHVLHVHVSKPTVPQYRVTLGIKSNTREGSCAGVAEELEGSSGWWRRR